MTRTENSQDAVAPTSPAERLAALEAELATEKAARLAAVAERDKVRAELEQFAYAASHDLQAPLRHIRSFADMLVRRYKDKLDADAGEFIGFIVEGATTAQDLVGGLLKYSRVTTRGKPPQRVNSAEVLEEALDGLRLSIEASDAVVEHGTLPEVVVDPDQLLEVFRCLIDNAIKFRRPGEPPRIHISATPLDPGAWVFSVRDNGMGIEPKYVERIFQVFQRLHDKKRYPGIGIGLPLCKKIVERHRGRMWVESEPEKGSTFHFVIPGEEGEQGHE